MVKRVTVLQWIQSALTDTDKGAACSAMALQHVRQIGGTEEVHSKEFPAGVPQSYAQLAEFFVDKACGFAQDLPGLQSFRLQAFYGGKQEAQASFTFTVFEGSLTAGETAPWSKHEPTTAGVVGLMMKNNEHMLSQLTLLTQGFTGLLVQQAVEHQKEKAEMNVLMRDVLLNMRKEAHESQMAQLKFARESEERAMLGKALPGLINHLTGREIVATSHVDSQIMEAMALKFGPEDLKLLVQLGKITQEQAMMLASRFVQIREEAEKRTKAIQMAPAEEGVPNVAE